MGVITEFVDMIRDINSLTEDQIQNILSRGDRRYTSISQRSLEGILQFPVIVSDSLDIETMQTVNKALEKQFASFVQTSITMSPFLNVASDKDAAGFLRKFHRNMGTTSTFRNDMITLVGSFAEDNSVYESYDMIEADGSLSFTNVFEGTSGNIKKKNKEELEDVLEGLNLKPLNHLYTPSSLRKQRFVEVSSKRSVKENDSGMIRQNLPNRVLTDNDVKKANELVPTTMHIRTIIVDEDGKPHGNLDFIAGIKATMHPVSSSDMVENVKRGVTKGGTFFRTLRLTSGEITFMKDYILNLTETREDVRRTTSKENKWWGALKRRKRLAKYKRTIMLPSDILPTASVVMSADEVEYMKNELNIDMMDPKNVRALMDEYFLISFNVVDVATGIVHFFFDGHKDFQSVTFSGLERGDVSGNGVDFRDVMKLVQRV